MSKPSTQVLVSNAILQQKEPGFLGEFADSRARAGSVQDEPRPSCCARTLKKEVLKNSTMTGFSKDTGTKCKNTQWLKLEAI